MQNKSATNAQIKLQTHSCIRPQQTNAVAKCSNARIKNKAICAFVAKPKPNNTLYTSEII